jgi:ABC-type lipoprotein release transport system permease subunit
MKEYFKIAWRNLWRNQRRTILTIASVLFAVFLALFMRSMQLGSYSMMIESSVKSSTGYIQIHKNGYWEDKTIDNTFETSNELQEEVLSNPNVTRAIPRLEAFALVSSGKQTKGVAVIGTNPDDEDFASGLHDHLIEGEVLSENDNGVLIPAGLANYLNANLNDTIVLLGQGYHGVTAAGAFPVRGIVEFIMPEQNNSILYLALPNAQYLYAAPNRITSLSLMLKDPDKVDETREELRAIDPVNLEYMTWKEMLTDLLQGIQGDNISGLFMLGILYMVVGFGILGTVLMMTMERRKEFGIMVAVGMRRYKLAIIIMLETIMVSIIGILAGIGLGLPVLTYFHHNPIPLTGEAANAVLEYNMEPVMPFLLEPGFFINQSIVVLAITLLTMLYPLSVINRFHVVKAIKGI